MATRLVRPQWSKVDLVDRPADPHAVFRIHKRDAVEKSSPTASAVHADRPVTDEDEEEYGPEERRRLAKSGEALEDGSFPIVTKKDLEGAILALSRAKDQEAAQRHIVKRAEALEAMELLPGSWQAEKKEGSMPEKLAEEVLKSLPQAAQDYITALESAQAEGGSEPSTGTVDITKRSDIPEDVLALIAKRDEDLAEIRKRAEEAEAVAKAERDARVLNEWRDRVAKFDGLGLDVEETAQNFKSLAETNSELAENLMKSLSGLREQAETSALFEEIGKAEQHANSAEGALETIVKSIQAEEKVSEAVAWDLALERNPELYARYSEEAR